MDDLTGRTFGRLTAIKRKMIDGRAWYICRCSCGVRRTFYGSNLRLDKSKSCGCRKSDVTAARNRANATHGHYAGRNNRGSTTYYIWLGMRARCKRPEATGYKYYGARGIRVCERWDKSFVAFLNDMGERPSKLVSLDRIDPDGHYAPENCRWADAVTQRHNRSKQLRT